MYPLHSVAVTELPRTLRFPSLVTYPYTRYASTPTFPFAFRSFRQGAAHDGYLLFEDSAHRVLGDSLRKRKNFQVQLFVQLEKKGLYWLLSLFSSRVVNLCSKPVWDWLHWTRVNCGPNSQELFLLPPCTCAVYSYIANGWKGIGAMW